jgi:hypothetical protein
VEALDGAVGDSGQVAARSSRTGKPSLRQLSTMEKIVATFGPASLLPRCIQFFFRSQPDAADFPQDWLRTRAWDIPERE